ncbi:phospholipid scramblase 1-like isoform X2 [Ornithodoros turicata]|uniref:phospholipid scramblase 1-like isoform X2 n=1 Tax=Ornithodoros turicata TaxID=34597 RepID=UPI003139B085
MASQSPRSPMHPQLMQTPHSPARSDGGREGRHSHHIESHKARHASPGCAKEQSCLECLAQLNEVSLYEMPKGSPCALIIQGPTNNNLFYLQIVSGSVSRLVFGDANGSFTMLMSQISGQVMAAFHRPLRLQSGCKGCFCSCLGQEMTIEAPPGTRVGSISEDCSTWGTTMTIRDTSGQGALKINGPALPPYCTCLINQAVFQVKSMAGTPVGEIWTDGNKCAGVSFPMDLNVDLKGCLIGCTILIMGS